MITLYHTLSSTSSKRALDWFQSHDIEVCKKRSYEVSREDLIKILLLSETGFSVFLKNRRNTGQEIKDKLDFIETLSFEEAINYIVVHPEVMRFPITFDNKSLLVGFHIEEIRQFIPRSHRLYNKN